MNCDKCTYCKEYTYCNYQGTCTKCGYSKPNWKKRILDQLWDWTLITCIMLVMEVYFGPISKILSWIGLTL